GRRPERGQTLAPRGSRDRSGHSRRLRVRLPMTARIADLEGTVSHFPGVVSCRWSPRTRSLLTIYRPAEIEAEAIVDGVVEQAGVDLAPVPDAPATLGNGSPGAAALVQTVSGV